MFRRCAFLLLVSYLFCPLESSAQHDSSSHRNAVSAGIFGCSVGFAMHYERQITRNKQYNLFFRQGVGRMRFGNNISPARTWLLPAGLLVGNRHGPHQTEMGLEATFCYGHRTVEIWPDDGTGNTVFSEFRANILIFAHVGYRYDWPQHRIFARAAFTPLIARIYPGREELNKNNLLFYPWAGGGIGWKF